MGEGQFDLAPAYAHPYVADSRYIDILKNGKTIAKVLVQIEYQGNALNSNGMAMNQDISHISNMLSSDLKSIAQNNNTMNISNMNMSNMNNSQMSNMNNQMNNMNGSQANMNMGYN